MVRKRQAKEPLFYIQQPKISKPVAPMQDNYATPKRTEKESPQQGEGNPSFTMPTRGNNFQQFQSPRSITPNESTEEDTQEQLQKEEIEYPDDDTTTASEENSRPRFKDMTLDEKITYFINIPSHIPKLKCEVTTEDRTYRGIIISRKEEEGEEIIVIRTGRRTFTITRKDINEIRLLGM